jgi:hypothetical protein
MLRCCRSNFTETLYTFNKVKQAARGAPACMSGVASKTAKTSVCVARWSSASAGWSGAGSGDFQFGCACLQYMKASGVNEP